MGEGIQDLSFLIEGGQGICGQGRGCLSLRRHGGEEYSWRGSVEEGNEGVVSGEPLLKGKESKQVREPKPG